MGNACSPNRPEYTQYQYTMGQSQADSRSQQMQDYLAYQQGNESNLYIQPVDMAASNYPLIAPPPDRNFLPLSADHQLNMLEVASCIEADPPPAVPPKMKLTEESEYYLKPPDEYEPQPQTVSEPLELTQSPNVSEPPKVPKIVISKREKASKKRMHKRLRSKSKTASSSSDEDVQSDKVERASVDTEMEMLMKVLPKDVTPDGLRNIVRAHRPSVTAPQIPNAPFVGRTSSSSSVSPSLTSFQMNPLFNNRRLTYPPPYIQPSHTTRSSVASLANVSAVLPFQQSFMYPMYPPAMYNPYMYNRNPVTMPQQIPPRRLSMQQQYPLQRQMPRQQQFYSFNGNMPMWH